MKLSFIRSLCATALLSVAVLAGAQQPTAKVHGHVTDPTGVPKSAGTVYLSQDDGKTMKYTTQLGPNGEFSQDGIAPGTYTMLLRLVDTPEGKYVDQIENVKITAGGDITQDFDMTRKEYMDKMTPEQRKQIEEFKKKNEEVVKTNAVIKNLNADLTQARNDNRDKKYDEAEALMSKDVAANPPNAELLYFELGLAQNGLKKYDAAVPTLQKTVELAGASKKPNPELIGGSHAALGEAYARSGKFDDAGTQYDAAAKANPTKAAFYYQNEAVVYFNAQKPDPQADAADKAIAADPKAALPYYLKGQALAGKITVDAKGAYVLPPGCAEAYNKYLELAPTGPYAPEVKAVLAETQTKVDNKYKAKK